MEERATQPVKYLSRRRLIDRKGRTKKNLQRYIVTTLKHPQTYLARQNIQLGLDFGLLTLDLPCLFFGHLRHGFA
jgi:hypothetical protein